MPFLPGFVAALMSGEVVAGFPDPGDPLALAAATIYVPTRRAARALAGELGRQWPGATALLPKIVPLGQMEGIETGLLFAEAAALDGMIADLPPAVPAMERRMTLAALALAWGQALRTAMLPTGGGQAGEAQLVATSPAQAWHLAGDLGALIDEMIIEGVPWDALGRLVPDEYDEYWSLTLKFLNIAADAWPKELAERGLMEAARRQATLAEREAERLTGGGAQAPVIAIGSTGTNRATARLLAAIARAPRGAVVLPGLDLDLDAPAWAMIGGDAERRREASAGHPQAALHRLLPQLGLDRSEVREIGRRTPALAARGRFLSEAFVPPEATQRWRSFDARLVPPALAGISLVEAADEREEALALALGLREALETPGRTAALITPARDLAQRVRAELARWGIEIDDSGGESLAATPAGAFAHLVLAARPGLAAPGELAALLAHPAARLGFERPRLEALAAALEIGLLRTILPDGGSIEEVIAAGREAARQPHAHPARRQVAAEDWRDLALLLQRLDEAFADLRRLAAGPRPDLAAWVGAHRAAIVALGGAGAAGEDWNALALLLDEIEACGTGPMSFDAEEYAALLDSVMRETIVRGPRRSHPRLKILGLLEARLIGADLVLLGGLDETIWPPQSSTDAFLNRPMRAELGLSPPERRLGQTAHDFIQALGASEAIISRALKRDGAPTVASRFLQRMAALAGDGEWSACRARGARLLDMARALDRPQASAPQKRPEPRPPVDLRPTRLSVTRIETLRRDPYAIHAEFILRLTALEPIGVALGARETGTELHGALADFALDWPKGKWPPDAREEILAIAGKRFEALLRNAEWRAFQWPRVERALSAYLGFELKRSARLAAAHIELKGRIAVPLADGSSLELTALADRIEEGADGRFTILDYKSGLIPTGKVIDVGFAPQLPLEAAMLERGAFACAPAGSRVADAAHVGLFGTDELVAKSVTSKNRTLEQLIEDHWNGLIRLASQFRDPQTPYVPRPYPQFVARFGAYDHLARVREWSAGQEGDAA